MEADLEPSLTVSRWWAAHGLGPVHSGMLAGMQGVWLDAHSAWLRYVEVPGHKPTCIYLHALGSAGSVDGPALFGQPGLDGRHALIVDFLGFGKSDRSVPAGYSLEEHAATIAWLLDARSLAGCSIVGHSLGGSVAIILGTARPDLVGRMVLAEANLLSGAEEGSNATMSRSIAAQSEAEFVGSGYADLCRQLAERWPGLIGALKAADAAAVHRTAVSLVAYRQPSLADAFLSMDVFRTYLISEASLEEPDMRQRAAQLAGGGIAVEVIPGVDHWMGLYAADGPPRVFAAAVSGALDRP